MTDFDGKFSIETNANSGTIVVSYVGYQSMTIAFDGSADLANRTELIRFSITVKLIICNGKFKI